MRKEMFMFSTFQLRPWSPIGVGSADWQILPSPQYQRSFSAVESLRC
jgi:hypothetical protein